MTPTLKTFQGAAAIELLFGVTPEFQFLKVTQTLKFEGQRVQLLEFVPFPNESLGIRSVSWLKYPPRSITRSEAVNVLSAALSRRLKKNLRVIGYKGDNRHQRLVVAIRPELTEEELEVEAAHQVC